MNTVFVARFSRYHDFEMACHRTDYEFIREYVLLSTYRHCTAFRHINDFEMIVIFYLN